MKDRNTMQEDRVRFLHVILDFSSETESADISFTKNKMMQKLNISDGEFHKIQKSLGQEYSHILEYNENREPVYSVNIARCWYLHDEYEQWAIHKENTELSKKLLRYTFVLLVVAALTFFVALPPALEALSNIINKVSDKKIETSKQNDNKANIQQSKK
jgi:hypothetical protein